MNALQNTNGLPSPGAEKQENNQAATLAPSTNDTPRQPTRRKELTIPINSRISASAHKALRILETTTNKFRVDVLSDALLLAAKQITIAPIVKFRLLDPEECLTLQYEISTLEQLHHDNRRRVKIRIGDKNLAEKAAKVIEKINSETLKLDRLRQTLGRQAVFTELVAEEIPLLKKLINLSKFSIEKAVKDGKETDRRAFELELKILESLFES